MPVAQAAAAAASGGCWYWDPGPITGYGAIGDVLWQYNVEPNWCGDGTYVTSTLNDVWPSGFNIGWQWDGNTAQKQWGTGWTL
jgi:hypothetical protein